jgi:uncharacterized protein YpmB
LVIFFNSQTGVFSRFFKMQSTESNVDAVISACNSLATSESTYAYCCEEKEVVFGKDEPAEKMTCFVAKDQAWASNRIGELSCAAVSCLNE